MGIDNLGNNFGKLAAQKQANLQKKDAVLENKNQVQDNVKIDLQNANAQINQAALKDGQKDLTSAFLFDKDVDFGKPGKMDDVPGDENVQYGAKGKSAKPKKKPHKHTNLEKSCLNEMQNDKTNGEWGAGAAIVYLGSRIYHWIKGD